MLTKSQESVAWMTGWFRHPGVHQSVQFEPIVATIVTLEASLVLKPPERIIRIASDSWQDRHQKKKEGFECVKLTE